MLRITVFFGVPSFLYTGRFIISQNWAKKKAQLCEN